MEFREFHLRKDPACPLCGEHPTQKGLVDYDALCAPRPEDRVREVSPLEVAARRARGEDFLLLDVREPHEVAAAALPGSQRIPLGQLERRAAELADWKERPIVVHCKSGGRSARAARALAALGFTDVASMAGGLDLWRKTVDPEPRG
jgi:adenylyltransferase/sulfurtransferase